MSAVKQRFCQNYFHFIARPLAQSMWVGACKHHKWTSLQLALRVWTVDMDMDGFKKEEEGGTKKCQCFAGTTRPPPLMPDAVSGPHTKKGQRRVASGSVWFRLALPDNWSGSLLCFVVPSTCQGPGQHAFRQARESVQTACWGEI